VGFGRDNAVPAWLAAKFIPRVVCATAGGGDGNSAKGAPLAKGKKSSNLRRTVLILITLAKPGATGVASLYTCRDGPNIVCRRSVGTKVVAFSPGR